MSPSIADILRYYRKMSGLTLKEVSDKSGISLVSLSKYEMGKRLPSVSNLHKLSEVLEFDYDAVYEVLIEEKGRKSN